MSTICCDCRRSSFFGINSSRNSPDSKRSLIHRLIISSCRLSSRSTTTEVSCAVFSTAIRKPPEIERPRISSRGELTSRALQNYQGRGTQQFPPSVLKGEDCETEELS